MLAKVHERYLKQYQGTAPVVLEQPKYGGHVGFATQSGAFSLGYLSWLPQHLLTYSPSITIQNNLYL
jgi:predicted alpha/beta-fold hydrolase